MSARSKRGEAVEATQETAKPRRRTVNALVGFRLKRVRSFFALGFGVERWNCYETGITWHAKVYLGPWVLLIDPRKSNTNLSGVETAERKP